LKLFDNLVLNLSNSTLIMASDNYVRTTHKFVQFLKIDVEGWELEVLKGCSNLFE